MVATAALPVIDQASDDLDQANDSLAIAKQNLATHTQAMNDALAKDGGSFQLAMNKLADAKATLAQRQKLYKQALANFNNSKDATAAIGADCC